jgi:hypothetical protein
VREYQPISPTDLMPKAGLELWPNIIPTAGIVIISGLTPDGKHALHVLHDGDSAPWVLIGMVKAVEADLIDTWVDMKYVIDGDEQ